MSFTSSGMARTRQEQIMAFTPTLLPLPVLPPIQ